MSLKKQQYYGYKNNTFWGIIHAIFDAVPSPDYEENKLFLLEKKIALWDVISCCKRDGSSLDSKIRNPVPNDITGFLQKYTGIEAIFFNGKKAKELYRRMICKDIPLENYILPSTSPARAIPYEDKLAQWELVRKVIDKQSKQGDR